MEMGTKKKCLFWILIKMEENYDETMAALSQLYNLIIVLMTIFLGLLLFQNANAS